MRKVKITKNKNGTYNVTWPKKVKATARYGLEYIDHVNIPTLAQARKIKEYEDREEGHKTLTCLTEQEKIMIIEKVKQDLTEREVIK